MDARDQSFLRAILDRPDDDAPRLIFADFLDETGRPERAEFVRLQCAAAAARHNHRPGGGKCRACVLHRRARELLLGHAVAWTPLPPFERPFALERVGPVLIAGQDGQLRLRFRRGFIDRVSLVFTDWLHFAAKILAAVPLREVRLTDWPFLPASPQFNNAYRWEAVVRGVWRAAGSPAYASGPYLRVSNEMVRTIWSKIKFTFAPRRDRSPPDRRPLTPPSVVMRKELSLR